MLFRSAAVALWSTVASAFKLSLRLLTPPELLLWACLASCLALAGRSGATFTGNPDKQDIVAEISGKEPELLDVIFECCGQQEAVDQAVELLKPGGKLMIIGIPEFDHWSFPADQLRRKELTIQNVRRQNETLDETLELLSTARIDVSGMATHRFPFEKTREAFEMVESYRDGVMKAMIDF